jgi:hypothetical protein
MATVLPDSGPDVALSSPEKRFRTIESARVQRTLFVVLLSVAGMLAYCDRVNISVAIIEMAQEHDWSMNERGQVCVFFLVPLLLCRCGVPVSKPFGLSASLFGRNPPQVLGSFFYGYLFSQIPGAVCASWWVLPLG